MTNTETVSTERLAEIIAAVALRRSTTPHQDEWNFFCEVQAALAELLASRTQSPAEWQVEAVAKIVYELNPFHEGGECVDGFLVSPGGDLSWDQACQRDQECAGVFLPVTKEARDTALKILRAASIPAPERSKEETGVRVKPLEWEGQTAVDVFGLRWTVYMDYGREDGKECFACNCLDGTWPTIEAAKAAAQAHFQQRILSALETPPLHKEGEAAKHSDACGCGYCT